MILQERQKSILETTIRKHIRTAKPIASQELLDELMFTVSPATIRNELQKLDELGYLEQPHASAGRIPTDKGYRFFVDHVEHITPSKQQQQRIDDIFDVETREEFIKACSRTISHITKTFTIVGINEHTLMVDTGLSELFDEPEFQDLACVKSFGRLIDFFGKDLPSFIKAYENNDETVFIGRENPVKQAQAYTMMISSWTHSSGFNGYITIVGPKRMDYEKNLSLMRYIENSYDGSNE